MADLRTEEFIVNMGPHHPSTHGVCRFMLTMDGEKIVKAEPVIGYLHRALEKICENRTYAQCIPVLDRFEYCTAMSCNQVFSLAVEKLAGIQVPERAEHLRVIMLELNRIASHLIWLGTTSLDLGALTPFLYAFRERESILDLFEMTCGQRLTFNYIRIGGVSKDIPPQFIPGARQFLSTFDHKVDDYERVLTENPIFMARNQNVGVMSSELALAYGVSGPNLRASGIKFDLRKDDTYSIYNRFKFDIPTGQNGDCYDRYMVRIREMRESAKIVRQALDALPEGDISAKFSPITFKAPAGELYSRIENSRGEMGVYLQSQDKEKKPLRVKLRGSSFNHLQVMPELVRGHLIADVVAVMASMDIILPDVDR
ncbi:MAG: NADH-quinone oxidoreductase subunit NuoD [candidate division Zixibacteria bacterium HGW-Zixibacteria-1]|nr:MAG: NADH-quinone oxidoreductase subunit NuoD [candidate division Zixibacteria bacterium HGW-Zixibacteria-1]